jgi:hypothetical protein
MQNLECGTASICSQATDDIVEGKPGGPQPDNAHLTGVILRLKTTVLLRLAKLIRTPRRSFAVAIANHR